MSENVFQNKSKNKDNNKNDLGLTEKFVVSVNEQCLKDKLFQETNEFSSIQVPNSLSTDKNLIKTEIKVATTIDNLEEMILNLAFSNSIESFLESYSEIKFPKVEKSFFSVQQNVSFQISGVNVQESKTVYNTYDWLQVFEDNSSNDLNILEMQEKSFDFLSFDSALNLVKRESKSDINQIKTKENEKLCKYQREINYIDNLVQSCFDWNAIGYHVYDQSFFSTELNQSDVSKKLNHLKSNLSLSKNELKPKTSFFSINSSSVTKNKSPNHIDPLNSQIDHSLEPIEKVPIEQSINHHVDDISFLTNNSFASFNIASIQSSSSLVPDDFSSSVQSFQVNSLNNYSSTNAHKIRQDDLSLGQPSSSSSQPESIQSQLPPQRPRLRARIRSVYINQEVFELNVVLPTPIPKERKNCTFIINLKQLAKTRSVSGFN